MAWAPGIGKGVHCWLLTSNKKQAFSAHFSCTVPIYTGLPAILTLDEARHPDLPPTLSPKKIHLLSCWTTGRYTLTTRKSQMKFLGYQSTTQWPETATKDRELHPEASDRLLSDLHTVDSFNGLPHASLLGHGCCNF